ncbi:MAG: hypothetical protein M9942_03810 [Microthrixaceae bacterium]|nr:hypothetical protein [Microthrixaceae bacterium]MCO5317544.1 hypothetical protein [Microthrixaceae bacterium]
MAQLGLDPEQMTQLSKTMKTEADSMDASAKKIDSKLRSAWWKGKDADKFRGDWEGRHRKALNDAARLLRDAAEHITRQVSEQNQASGH